MLFMLRERQHRLRFSKTQSTQGINEFLGLGRALSYIMQRHPDSLCLSPNSPPRLVHCADMCDDLACLPAQENISVCCWMLQQVLKIADVS